MLLLQGAQVQSVARELRSHMLCVHTSVLSHFSHFQLFSTLWTTASQTPLSKGFFREEYCSGLPFQGIFLTQGWNPSLLHCRRILNHWATGKANHECGAAKKRRRKARQFLCGMYVEVARIFCHLGSNVESMAARKVNAKVLVCVHFQFLYFCKRVHSSPWLLGEVCRPNQVQNCHPVSSMISHPLSAWTDAWEHRSSSRGWTPTVAKFPE